ncbi:Hpt domain-containing protein [Pseudomonas aeruginosa]|nr:Hpt domain-containing protein [Pseudomonas aeruginosa]
MPQDMSQFLQVFFEETEEHLATLELLLIGLDLDRPDSETLHGIFRAAHSIKGSSGMFGFDDITAVTHELETLLDRIRCGQMHLRPDMISSFLEARDVLQRLLDAHRSGRPAPGCRCWRRSSACAAGCGCRNRKRRRKASACSTTRPPVPPGKPRTTMPSASSTKARALRNERPRRERSGSSTRRPAHRPRAKRSASSMRHRVPHRRRNAPSACSTAPPAAPPRPVRPRKPSPRRPGAQSRQCVATASPARSGSAWKRSTA